MSKQNKIRLIDVKNKLIVARGEGVRELGEKGEGFKKKQNRTKQN